MLNLKAVVLNFWGGVSEYLMDTMDPLSREKCVFLYTQTLLTASEDLWGPQKFIHDLLGPQIQG